jgi:uncharacterized protein (TIGR02453 family)
MPAAAPYFTSNTLRFFSQLTRHNDKAWFEANREAYERDVREPCLRFIADMVGPLATISPAFVASPKKVGGSLFRIHRDTRFSKDKTPYKTHAGMTFFHGATRAAARADAGGSAAPGRLDAPLFYFHLTPGDSFIGGGIWHPQAETLRRIRAYIVNNPASWKQATQSAAFRRQFALTGDSLSRPPKGFDPAHPLIEDLKRKDFVAGTAVSDEDLLRPDLPKLIVSRYRVLAPMIDWLCGALDLDF